MPLFIEFTQNLKNPSEKKALRPLSFPIHLVCPLLFAFILAILLLSIFHGGGL